MSLTRTVPVEVPSLFHNSTLVDTPPTAAEKNTAPLTATRFEGEDSGFVGRALMSVNSEAAGATRCSKPSRQGRHLLLRSGCLRLGPELNHRLSSSRQGGIEFIPNSQSA